MRYYPFNPPKVTSHQKETTKRKVSPKKQYKYLKRRLDSIEFEEIPPHKQEPYFRTMDYLHKLANPRGYTRSNYTIEQITNKLEQHEK